MRSFCFCVLMVFLLDSYNAIEYRQERAVVKYYNPKYVSHAQAFTSRRSRRDAYTSNVTITNLYNWNNNVTMKLAYQIMHGDLDFYWKVSICDTIKYGWLVEFVKQYSDVSLKCPLEKGTYHFYNLIFPPKNYPLPLPQGNTIIELHVYITKTLEQLIDLSIRLYI